MRVLTPALAMTLGVLSVPAFATTYDLFDHRNAAHIATYDYGLRMDDLAGVARGDASTYWSFESEDGASLAQLIVDVDAGFGTLSGQMRNNATDDLWDISLNLNDVEQIHTDGSFGAQNMDGVLSFGSTSYALTGKSLDYNGTQYDWLHYYSDPGNNARFRPPNISHGWVGAIDGNMFPMRDGFYNDFLAEFVEVPAPVPVPAALILLMTALGGLGFVRFRNA